MGIRSYGLSGSGMDVEQMVKSLMEAQRASYNKIWQKKTQLEWKKADYYTIYTSIQEFRNTVFNYRLTSTTLPKSVSSSAEGVVAATANADAANVSHSIKVTQLAEGARLTSIAGITVENGNKSNINSQLGLELEEGTEIKIKLSNGGASTIITLDPSNSIYDFVSAINNSGLGINANGLGIKANYDANLDRLFVYTTGSGVNAQIKFEGIDEEGQGTNEAGMAFLQALKLGFVGEDPDNPTLSLEAQGKNAKFVLDGMTLEQEKNTFTISGVTYNLKAVGEANLVVSSNNDQAIKAVKDFINSYNALLEKINGELKEAVYPKYLPLTDEQKSELSEHQIKEWEELARSGMLRRDTILQDTVYKLRTDISTAISGLAGKYTSLSAIGITTGDYSEGGKLYLNETKLREALENDPDVVYRLFASSGDDWNSQGVAVRLYDTLKSSMDRIRVVAGATPSVSNDTESFLAKQIQDYEKSLDRMDDRLKQIEDRYYKQFDAMELALSKLTQQSNWLVSMFNNK